MKSPRWLGLIVVILLSTAAAAQHQGLPFTGAFRGGGTTLILRALYPGYVGELYMGGRKSPVRVNQAGAGIQGRLLNGGGRFFATLTPTGIAFNMNGRKIYLQRFDLAVTRRAEATAARRRAAGPIPRTTAEARGRLTIQRWYTPGPVRASSIYLRFHPNGQVEQTTRVTGSSGNLLLGTSFVTRTIVSQQLVGRWGIQNGRVQVHLQHKINQGRTFSINQRFELLFKDGATLVEPRSKQQFKMVP